MEVKMAPEQMNEMIDHCRAAFPNEGCGMLGAKDGRVVKVFRMTNIEASPMRYRVDSAEQNAVYNTLAKEGWDLGGVFHSHTRTEAYPSPTDVSQPNEDVPFVIVSLMDDPPVVRAFRIVKESFFDTTGDIVEIPMVVEG